MKYYLLLLYIIGVLFPLNAFSETPDNSISGLLQKCEEARGLSQYEVMSRYSQQLLQQAKGQGNNNARAYALFYDGLAKVFLGKGQEAQQVLDEADSMATLIGNDSVRALVMNARGIYHAVMQNNNFVAQQYFFKSVELSKRARFEDLQHRVMGNLITLSQYTGGNVALDAAKSMYDYGVKTNNNEQIALGAYYLAVYYYKHQQYDDTEKYLKIALDIYDKYPYEDIAWVYSLYAKLLIDKNELQGAKQKAQEAVALTQRYRQQSMEVDAHIVYAEALNKMGQYEESMDEVQTAMAIANEIGMESKLVDCYELLSNNYAAIGRDVKALECLQKANELMSSQMAISMERLSHEQQIMREIEQKEMDAMLAEEQVASQRSMLIVESVAVAILLILLVVIIYFYRHRQVLYKKIVLQNSRAVNRQVEMQRQIDALLQEKELWQQGGAGDGDGEPVAKVAEKERHAMGDDKIDSLYAELCRLMEHEHLYTESQLTRERMAEQLGTNRTYLVKVIKEKTGMNYLQFVNSYRINEAIKILSSKDKISYPLKQIWSDLGFSSPSTFFKLFQQAVGITPAMYRKQFLEVNVDDNETSYDDDNDDDV